MGAEDMDGGMAFFGAQAGRGKGKGNGGTAIFSSKKAARGGKHGRFGKIFNNLTPAQTKKIINDRYV